LIRFSVLIYIVFCVCLVPGGAQPVVGNQIDANPALFTVMAAINAMGYDAEIDSPTNSPVRRQVRAALAGKHFDSLDDLKRFMTLHRQRDANAELSQYISFALAINGPPNFDLRIPEHELPPDVTALRGLELILPQFYKEAGIEQLWRQVLPEYEKVIEEYHGPVSQMAFQSNVYLRFPTSGAYGRRFQVLIDLMAAPNQIQTRNYKDDYFVVITSTPELPMEQIQYAYLHYLLDPLALRFSEQLEKKRGIADYAQGAPALPDAYKDDYMLLTTSCLAKAVESRLIHGEANRQAKVEQALKEGFVFTPAFADGLVAYEKQPQAMRLYFPELVNNIDLAREEARLDKVEFAKTVSGRTFKTTKVAPEPELTGIEKTLETAEDLYRNRNLEKAREAYLQVLQQTTQRPLHAKAYYGLARIAALQRDPELAEKLFQKTLELSPDPQTRSWTYVYLGRLAAAAGESAEAMKSFRAAAAVEGASPAAKSAAEKEIEKSSNQK
jgi:tetratricopeptide (TPR) repeat protein